MLRLVELPRVPSAKIHVQFHVHVPYGADDVVVDVVGRGARSSAPRLVARRAAGMPAFHIQSQMDEAVGARSGSRGRAAASTAVPIPVPRPGAAGGAGGSGNGDRHVDVRAAGHRDHALVGGRPRGGRVFPW